MLAHATSPIPSLCISHSITNYCFYLLLSHSCLVARLPPIIKYCMLIFHTPQYCAHSTGTEVSLFLHSFTHFTDYSSYW